MEGEPKLCIRGLTSDSKLCTAHSASLENLQRQIQHVKRTADGDADRIRRRTEAEISDFRNRIAELEAELQKVTLVLCFNSKYSNHM
jgi:septal ring factor EnvC (AmiA/AmiB activator)